MQETAGAVIFYGFWSLMAIIVLALALGIPALLVTGLVHMTRNSERKKKDRDSLTDQ